jgi:hypothetical protein
MTDARIKPLQQILDEMKASGTQSEILFLGKFCDELRANGWVFVHLSQIEGKPPVEEILRFPETGRMDS